MGQRGHSLVPKLISAGDKRGRAFGFCKWMDCKLIVSTKLTNVHRQSSNIFTFLWFGLATHIPSLFRKMWLYSCQNFRIQDDWKNSIQNIQGKLKAPVVIEAGSHYLSCLSYKNKEAKLLFTSKCTVANNAAVNKYRSQKLKRWVYTQIKFMSTTYRLRAVQHFHCKHTWVEVDDLFLLSSKKSFKRF